MAIQKGRSLHGKFGDEVHYKAEGKHVVRSAPVVDPKRFATDPAYANVRQMNTEFANLAHASKLFRDTLAPFIFDARAKRLSAHVNQLMGRIRDCSKAPRGERSVNGALSDPSTANVFNGFQFNPLSPVQRLLKATYKIDWATATLYLSHLNPRTMIAFPEGATHVQLSCCMARFDFASGTGDLRVSPVVELTRHSAPQDVVLTVAGFPEGPGPDLFLLKVVFLMQASNGDLLDLRDGGGNGAMILGVRSSDHGTI